MSENENRIISLVIIKHCCEENLFFLNLINPSHPCLLDKGTENVMAEWFLAVSGVCWIPLPFWEKNFLRNILEVLNWLCMTWDALKYASQRHWIIKSSTANQQGWKTKA